MVKNKSNDRTVLLLGGGAAAESLAVRLGGGADGGPDGDRISWLRDVHILQCTGWAGNFKAVLAQQNRQICIRSAAVVLSGRSMRRANFDDYGLRAAERVWSAGRLEMEFAEAAGDVPSLFGRGACVVFLNSWRRESHPAETERLLRMCLRIQREAAARTFFLTGNLKVAAPGVEALCLEAKRAGTLFLKFDRQQPMIEMLADGRARFACADQAGAFILQATADWTIVDETAEPAELPEAAAAGLWLERDAQGFRQADNVRRLPNGTNRRGVFATGAARAVMSEAAAIADAEQTALRVVEFLENRDREELPAVTIHPENCARCLTCFRICPYGAVRIGVPMQIVPEACWACGRCVAECPGRAIEMGGRSIDVQAAALAPNGGKPTPQRESRVRLAVMCCTRSAGLARKLMPAEAQQPAGAALTFIEGLCGGAIAARHLLAAFEAGLDGVLVITCHPDNCHSGGGPQQARRTAEAVKRELAQAGIAGGRLEIATLAANMADELAAVLSGFAARVARLCENGTVLPT